MLVMAIFTGALSLLNYAWWVNFTLSSIMQIVSVVAQAALLTATVVAAIRYRGRRQRRSYDGAGYKIFTLPFAIICISLLGNLSVLVVLTLRMAGVITAL